MVPQAAARVPGPAQNGQMSEPLHEGDQAMITRGPLEGRVGTIAAITGEVAILGIDVFARHTPVEVLLADLAVPPGAS